MALYTIQSDATSIGASANDDNGDPLRTMVDRLVDDLTALKAAFSPDDAGGIYLGGSGAANRLDDYEEGTFTAALTCGTSGTITLSLPTLSYTKIGNLVNVRGMVQVTSVVSPLGGLDLTGLPFAVANFTNTSERVATYVGANGLAGVVNVLQGQLINLETLMSIMEFDGTTFQDDVCNHIQAGTLLWFNFSYPTT